MEPETANEFLAGIRITPKDVTLSQYQANSRAVGVGFEEAGEKWRAGDSAKSLRFFVRAIDVYDAVNPSTHHPSTTHNTTSLLKYYSAKRQQSFARL